MECSLLTNNLIKYYLAMTEKKITGFTLNEV